MNRYVSTQCIHTNLEPPQYTYVCTHVSLYMLSSGSKINVITHAHEITESNFQRADLLRTILN